MPESDNKKKKFNPYLAPTESDDEPKLDDEEEKTPEPSPENEEDESYEEGGDIVIENPGEEVYEEELVDEMTAQSPQKQKESTKVIPKPRSWSFYAFGLIVVLVICDVLAQRMGANFFWTPRSIYIMSYVFRVFVLLIAAYAWHRSLFRDNRAEFRAVFIWLGLVSGALLALWRFVSDPSFWAFINMIVEPLDSAIVALGAWYVVVHLTSKLQLIHPVR